MVRRQRSKPSFQRTAQLLCITVVTYLTASVRILDTSAGPFVHPLNLPNHYVFLSSPWRGRMENNSLLGYYQQVSRARAVAKSAW